MTISALATAGGTLVLAGATFSSVRSANRAARVAERSLLLGLRPVLVPSRPEDAPERVTFVDHSFSVDGGTAHVEEREGRLYFAFPLRNVGAGLAVLHSWEIRPRVQSVRDDHGDPERFRAIQRDLYVAAGDTGYWQGALREADDASHGEVRSAIEAGQPLIVEVLYGDHEGGQRTISRFGITPSEDGGDWSCNVLRHWQLEGIDPRHTGEGG